MWSLCHVGGRALQDYLPDGVKTLTVMKKRLADLELDSLKEITGQLVLMDLEVIWVRWTSDDAAERSR